MLKNFLQGEKFIPVEKMNLVIILLKFFLVKILEKTTFFFLEKKQQQRNAAKKGSDLPLYRVLQYSVCFSEKSKRAQEKGKLKIHIAMIHEGKNLFQCLCPSEEDQGGKLKATQQLSNINTSISEIQSQIEIKEEWRDHLEKF